MGFDLRPQAVGAEVERKKPPPPQRAEAPPSPAAALLATQRAAGNAAAVALAGRIQRKLLVGSVDDPAEREADAIAAKVAAAVRAPEGRTAGQFDAGRAGTVAVRRRASASPATDGAGHGPQGGHADPAVAAEIQAVRSSGSPLASGVRTPFEQAFGADLGAVRVHADANADRLSRSLNAEAFTTGSDIFFTKGAYNPTSAEGTELLAHELTHVVQQAPTVRRRTPKAQGGPSGTAEQATVPGPRSQAGGQGLTSIKVVIAGSGYGKWATHAAEGLVDEQWLRQGTPDKSVWTTHTKGDSSTARSYLKTGGNQKQDSKEILFAGPGGPGARSATPFRRKTKLKKPGGTMDVGSNSIANIVKTAPRLIIKLLGQYDPKQVKLIIKAHSRGAVAGAMVANRLKNLFPDIELTLFDPVPGPADLRQSSKLRDNYESQDLSKIGESTVVYSIASGYGALGTSFEPMKAMGVKRIILSAQGHSAGLLHGFAYIDPQSQQLGVYKGSALNKLPPGVYLDKSKGTDPADRDNNPLEFKGHNIDDDLIKDALNDAKSNRSNRILDRGRVPRIRSALGKMQ